MTLFGCCCDVKTVKQQRCSSVALTLCTGLDMRYIIGNVLRCVSIQVVCYCNTSDIFNILEEIFSKMTGESNDCANFFKNHLLLDKWQSITITCYAISINGVLCLILNLLVIVLLVKTKQTNIPPMKVVFYLSISDVGVSVSVLVLAPLLFMTLTSKTYHCIIEVATVLSVTFFGILSLLLMTVMSYYRYACVKHLRTHTSKFKQQLTMLTIGCVLFASFSTILVFIQAITYNRLLPIISQAFYLSYVLTVVYFMIISARTIRKRRRQVHDQSRLQETFDVVSSMSKKFLYALIIFQTDFIIMLILAHSGIISNAAWREFLSYMAVLLCLTNSSVDALIFLCLNKKCKKYLADKWGKITKNVNHQSLRGVSTGRNVRVPPATIFAIEENI